MKTKICTNCNKRKYVKYYYANKATKDKLSSWCKTCSIKTPELQAKHHRKWKLKSFYNIDESKFNELLLAQNSKCCICKKSISGNKICIDHDHKTGKVRGLLCHKCNSALGLFHDSLEILKSAINYINSNLL